jgi:hypothetical protein
MHFLRMSVGLFALICCFGAVNAKTAGQPAGTLNKPAEVEGKTAGRPAGTL